LLTETHYVCVFLYPGSEKISLWFYRKVGLLVARGWGGRGGDWGKGGEMTQTLYAHMNKMKKKKGRLRKEN
jgi:hypothetical protein